MESMHGLLDVRFDEDYLRVVSKTIQENINLLRKFVQSMIWNFLKIDFRGKEISVFDNS